MTTPDTGKQTDYMEVDEEPGPFTDHNNAPDDMTSDNVMDEGKPGDSTSETVMDEVKTDCKTSDAVIDESKPNDKTSDTVIDEGRHKTKDNSHLVQITASNAEIARRIAALIEQKQNEVDENNRQEFCNVHPSLPDLEDSCARTASVFVPRAGGKSHIKVSRVVNMYGPQTRALGSGNDTSPYKQQIKREVSSMDGIEERLANMEDHLKLKGFSKTDVYSRLKSLEERILFLESISPEYFTSGPPPLKRKKTDSRPVPSTSSFEKDISLSEIDDRIRSLTESLLKKSLAR